MVHDEIKAAARRRVAQTGEPYCLARRKVIEEHKRSASRSVKAGKTVLPIPGPVSATGENWFWHIFRARFGVSRMGQVWLL
jgi:hypothetical protein